MSLPRCNTKIFNNLQELWKYCEKCLICQKGRIVSLSPGPENVFKIDPNSFALNKKEYLNIKFGGELYIKKEKFHISFDIDAYNNIFSFDILLTDHLTDDDAVYDAKSSYLYMYINTACKECYCHTSSTTDIELNLNTNTISSIGLEQENIYFCHKDKKIEFELDYLTETANILIFSKDKKKHKSQSIPFMEYDFANSDKLLQKLQTIITFG